MEAEAREILRRALQEESQTTGKRRAPPESIAGKGRTVGDLVGPFVDEGDWECLK
jgi:plasmid stability protein